MWKPIFYNLVITDQIHPVIQHSFKLSILLSLFIVPVTIIHTVIQALMSYRLSKIVVLHYMEQISMERSWLQQMETIMIYKRKRREQSLRKAHQRLQSKKKNQPKKNKKSPSNQIRRSVSI